MRTISLIIALLLFAGCVTVEIPKYLEDEYQYQRNFDVSFNEAFAATSSALNKLGWKISGTESSMFAKISDTEEAPKGYGVLILTQMKQRSLILTSTYIMLNANVKSIEDNKSQVELRYLSITVIPPFFKQWRVDRNDGLIEKLYQEIEKNINNSKKQ